MFFRQLWFRKFRIASARYARRYYRVLVPLIFATFSTLIFLLTPIFNGNWVQKIELEALKLTYWMRGPLNPPIGIAIVGLDNQSREELNLSALNAWPRKTVADILLKVSDAGATGIAVDLIFATERTDPADDQALVEALELTKPTIGSARDAVRQPLSDKTFLKGFDPFSTFSKAAKRVIPMTLWTARNPEKLVTYISEDRGEDAERVPLLNLFPRNSPVWFYPPLNDDMINFYGPPGTLEIIPAAQVFKHFDSVKDLIRGKFVFIGQTNEENSTALSSPRFAPVDTFSVPSSPFGMSGVEIHATIYANLRDRSWLRNALSSGTECLTLVACTLLVQWIVFLCPYRFRAVAVVILVCCWFWAALIAIRSNLLLPGGVLILIALPIGAATYSFLELSIRRWRHPSAES